MSILDLSPSIQGVAMGPQPGEATDLPVTFGQAFEAAWNENQLFGQSVARSNARLSALDDYVNEVRQKTGKDIGPEVMQADAPDYGAVEGADVAYSAANEGRMWMAAQNAAQKLGLPALSDQDIEDRAIAKSRAARTAYAEIAAREKAAGGGIGGVLGGLAGATTDPINLVAAPIGAGEGGILATALRFGAIAAGTQAANEVAQAPFREAVQPGYAASGEPLGNVLTAGVEGAALGGGTRFLGNLWTRAKTGAWPRSVRDAGNLAESEANVQQSNVYPGAAGEVAHRQALSDAIDSVLKGEPVDVSKTITPELEASTSARVEPERAAAMEAIQAAKDERTAAAAVEVPELPFDATAAQARAEQATGMLAQAVTDTAARGGHALATDEAATIADRMANLPPEEAAGASREIQVAPYQAAERLAQPLPRGTERPPQPPPMPTRGPAARDEQTFSLFEFLARRGGLAPNPEIETIFGGKNPFVPGFGRLIRKTGMSLDRAREAAVEAGYLLDPAQQHGGITESTINHLLEAIDAEARGSRVYRMGEERAAAHNRDEELFHINREIDAAFEENGLDLKSLSDKTRGRVVEMMRREGVRDPLEAYERAILEEDRNAVEAGHEEPAEPISGFDVPDDAEAASGQGGPTQGPGPQTSASAARRRNRAPTETIPALTAAEREAALSDPKLATAMQTDLDRVRMLKDVQVPAGVDERGEPVYRSLDAAVAEIEGDHAAADQLEACISPAPEEPA